MDGKQSEKHVYLCNSRAIVKGVANICLNAATGQNQSVVLWNWPELCDLEGDSP